MEKQIKYQIAESDKDFEKCKDIIVEYLDTLGIDLEYMNLQNESSK